jgi:multiple sugar transport system permease protein
MATESAVADRATPATRTKTKKPKKEGTPWWMWIAVLAIVVFCLFPFYWLINLSLKTGADLGDSSLIPPHPTLKNYQSIFNNSDFTKALRNSAIISLFTTFPAIAIAAPLFRLWSNMPLGLPELFDTIPGLIIPNLTFALPLAIYILVSFFKEIPKDLEEAALVDGATHFTAFRKVVVPLAAPGLATAGILTFIATWNEFLLAITLTSTPKARPVPAAIAFFTGSTQFEIPYGTITAASVTISVPLILLVLFFQKRIVAGLTAGAVKG